MRWERSRWKERTSVGVRERMAKELSLPNDGAGSVDAGRLGDGERTAAWVFSELEYVRREAQVEAELAYEAWCQLPGGDGYAVYRAAQDRADAAQDQLAGWVRGSRSDRSSERPWNG
jgi:hypothetical protein